MKIVKLIFRDILKQVLENAAEQNIDHYFYIAQNDGVEIMEIVIPNGKNKRRAG
jgi:hypothetical protein